MIRNIFMIVGLVSLCLFPIICIAIIWTDYTYEWEVFGTDLVIICACLFTESIYQKMEEQTVDDPYREFED